MTETRTYVSHDLLEKLRGDILVLQLRVRDILIGRTVKFRSWLWDGRPRTGVITDVSVMNGRISIGVAVDRVDGRVGFLVDTWYGALASVEVDDAL